MRSLNTKHIAIVNLMRSSKISLIIIVGLKYIFRTNEFVYVSTYYNVGKLNILLIIKVETREDVYSQPWRKKRRDERQGCQNITNAGT